MATKKLYLLLIGTIVLGASWTGCGKESDHPAGGSGGDWVGQQLTDLKSTDPKVRLQGAMNLEKTLIPGREVDKRIQPAIRAALGKETDDLTRQTMKGLLKRVDRARR